MALSKRRDGLEKRSSLALGQIISYGQFTWKRRLQHGIVRLEWNVEMSEMFVLSIDHRLCGALSNQIQKSKTNTKFP